MDKIKPCPFCGGEAFVATVEHPPENRPNGYRFHGQIMCRNCQASAGTTGFDLTHEEATRKAIAAWNRRTHPDNEPLVRCENCIHWDKSISFMGAHACAYWSPSRKEPRYTEWFEFCSFASAKPERNEG